MQRIYGSPNFKDFKLRDIESISFLKQNLFSICLPNMMYLYDTDNENSIGHFRINVYDKKIKLLKPENNILMVKSKWEISLYDLESLMIFQKLEISDIDGPNEPIKKVKQLTNNNIIILFITNFAIYNLQKNTITYKCNYFDNNINDRPNGFQGYLMELNPNFVLVNF